MIKNLLFDFGDVFIDLDKGATLRILSEKGLTGIRPELYSVIYDYEKGKVSTEEFLRKGMEYLPEIRRDDLITAWNAIILDFPEHRLDFITDLAINGSYRLFLFSNTNGLHIEKVIERMGSDRYSKFMSCFEGFYLSHEVGMRKPDPEVFEMFFDKNRLSPGETLFVDDTLEHIQSADRLGLYTWHLQVGKEEVTELFKHLGG
ncbi:putative hydrolase of the HAD superfamily [Muriicola jejuensis]|uniref:HAD-IA family hydrolase n=1 Tax=Muriicola jejuensis TaxID=504488 RepID=A0A6P0UEJ7_9FLAO|nr:HAD family phosphatase [Muriicola jejuensis]NER11052.1 HAD-IA family hydrolase [Muriicola jejuensis]SMP23213.1 putative hydrolase of the HAD superfamily [Muriicola jejuensis]